ncbi:DUF6059 family protein [Streptacidiphilus monticola]|uniref:DUF6059 family protein n=1 Tax=Streptacidiphilus monticola TaxID=2161674 RepID=A0ABW1G387_9ACTN
MSWIRRCTRVLDWSAPGLAALGGCLTGVAVPWHASAGSWGARRSPHAPPPGHPERPAGHIPPTRTERALWAAARR